MSKYERKRGARAFGAQAAPGGKAAPAVDRTVSPRSAQVDKRRQVMLHIGTSASTFVANITGLHGNDMSGYIYHMYTETYVPFRTLFEAVLSIQKITDALDYPQRGYRLRSWRDAPNPFAGYGDGDRLSRRFGMGQGVGYASARGPSARRDAPQEPRLEPIERPTDAKPLATLIIRVQYRQNASWQGEAIWSGASTSVKFRSVLELLMLVTEACEGCAKPPADEEPKQ